MKRVIALFCLLLLGLLAACGGAAEASPGADAHDASPEERTFMLGDLTLILPETVQDPRWSGPKGGVAQAEFSWGGENYVYRVKKSRRAENLSDISDMPFTGPEGGELAADAPRCVVDGAKGYIAWYAHGHAFTLSMEENANDRKLVSLYNVLRKDRPLSDFFQPPLLWARCDFRDVPAERTTYTWASRTDPGEDSKSFVVADGIHPLQMLDKAGRVSLTPLLISPGAEVELDFELAPEKLTVRCWPEETARAVFEDPALFSASVEQGVELTVTEGRIAPPGPGNYIYEVRAAWSDDAGYGGTAYYGFYSTGIPD